MVFVSKLTALLGSLSAVASALPTADFLEARSSAEGPPRDMVYVQTFHNNAGGNLTLLPLINHKTGITHIELAAIHINDDPNDIHLNNDNVNSSIYDNIWSEVAQIQKTGVKVLFMMGGYGVGDYEHLCSGKNKKNPLNMTYYEPLKYTIQYHNIQGIDLDIEETSSNACALSLLKQFDADFGADFILAMSPVADALFPGGTGFGPIDYHQLDHDANSTTRASGKLVNYYNCQFYNGFGDASSTSDYDTIVGNGFSPARVVMGLLDAAADGNDGNYNVSTYQRTIRALKAEYANFGGTIGWEYYNAGTDDGLKYPWQWVKAIGKAIGTVTKRFIGSL